MQKIDISTKTFPDTFVFVDDKDYDKVKAHKWFPCKRVRSLYAETWIGGDVKPRRRVSMHRFIMNTPKGVLTDHKDGNGLHNWRSNLRTCTHSQNGMNRRVNTKSGSGYKGVIWRKEPKKWPASIGLNGKTIPLGYFTCLIKAAKAYDEGAKKYFGEFARLNFKE